MTSHLSFRGEPRQLLSCSLLSAAAAAAHKSFVATVDAAACNSNNSGAIPSPPNFLFKVNKFDIIPSSPPPREESGVFSAARGRARAAEICQFIATRRRRRRPCAIDMEQDGDVIGGPPRLLLMIIFYTIWTGRTARQIYCGPELGTEYVICRLVETTRLFL